MAYWEFFISLYFILMRLIGVLAVLMVIVTVHEFGHYLIGRWCGIKAAVFSVGFGPEIYAWHDRRGTRWRLALLPLGGYVRFAGEESTDSALSQIIIEQNKQQGHFAAADAWKKAITVFAGPLFNGILAFCIFSIIAFHFGKLTVAPVVSQVLPNSPAAQAGLQEGDRFLAINGDEVRGFEDISQYVMMHGGEAIRFTVNRQGKSFNVTVTPKTERADDGFGNIIKVGRIGIAGSNTPQNIHKQTYTTEEAVWQGLRDTGFIIQQTGLYIKKLVEGRGDRCQLSGPVRTAQIAWKVSDIGAWALLQLAALLSVGIGLFNLLPLPPLDGGHLLFYLVECLTGYAAPARLQEIVFRAGWVIIILFTGFAILNNSIPC